jgi:hypothetical protein
MFKILQDDNDSSEGKLKPKFTTGSEYDAEKEALLFRSLRINFLRIFLRLSLMWIGTQGTTDTRIAEKNVGTY